MANAVTTGVVLGEKILEAILDVVGVEPILALIAARVPRDQALAFLAAQYNAQEARVDAEAERELRPAPPTKVVP